MSKYGRDYYGIGFYGPFSIAQYSAYPFTATSRNYGVINLKWTFPTGSWAQIRVLRNSYGFPVSAADGVVIVDTYYDQAPTEYLDAGDIIDGELQYLTQGKFYYYSVFVRENTGFTWVRAANAIGLSIKDFTTSETMYDYLPDALKVNSLNGDVLTAENETLKNFLKIFGFEYDRLKTYALNTLHLYDISTLPGSLFPQMLEQYGGCFEPEIGLKQQRVLLRNLFNIYKDKGSYQGLETFVKSFSGYDTVISKGQNLFLDYNDSSFEESVGNWTATGATLATYAGTALTIYPYAITLPTGYPNRQYNMLKVTSTGTSTITLSCGNSQTITKGIPVTYSAVDPNLNYYTFSIYTAANTNTRSIRAGIQFYDRFGNAVGSLTQGVPVTNAVGTWSRLYVTAIAPSTAVYASVQLTITSPTNGEIHYFDAGQFEQDISYTAFQDARRINIELLANRINEIPNPTFTSAISPWSATNATLALTNSTPGVDVREFVVSNKELTSNVATLTVSDSYLPLFVGDDIVVTGVGAPFDGSYAVLASNPSGKTVSYTKVAANVLSTPSSGEVYLSGDSLEVTASGASQITLKSYTSTSDYYDVLSDNDYSFSIYIQPAVGSELITANINWYDSSNALINTTTGTATQCPPVYTIESAYLTSNVATVTLNEAYNFSNYAGDASSYITIDGLGSPYDGTWEILSTLNKTVSYSVTNVDIPVATVSGTATPQGIWYRVSVTGTAPATAVKASADLTWIPSVPGNVVYIEDALFEKSSFILDYFDGERSGQEDGLSLLWEGTPDASRSHYYKNKFSVEDRLKRELEKYVLLGSTYALYFAQP